MKIDTLLFDLDGTLIDSIELILISLQKTMKVYFPELVLCRSDLMDMVGPPLYETFGRFTADTSLVDSMIHHYRKIYSELEFNYIRIYPGVLETLQYFHEKKYHIAVVTTKFSDSAAPSIHHFGLDQYIDLVIALNDVTHPKPHPESVLLAMKRLNGHFGVMIGDMPSDLMAGRNGGILTCGVGWTTRQAALKATNPDFWINDMTELMTVIQKYNEED